MRLEGVAPFGPPAFILAARGDVAVLLLPRDDRVLRGARPEDILGALTGISLGPADLQAILTGCVAPDAMPTGGRLYANGWASIELSGGSSLYLQPVRGGQAAAASTGARSGGTLWQLRVARRSGWRIEYSMWNGTFPGAVRLQSEDPALDVDLNAQLSQVETNVDLSDQAFSVDVPANAESITLDELRANGPLGER